jgi:hypothetical protein
MAPEWVVTSPVERVTLDAQNRARPDPLIRRPLRSASRRSLTGRGNYCEYLIAVTSMSLAASGALCWAARLAASTGR